MVTRFNYPVTLALLPMGGAAEAAIATVLHNLFRGATYHLVFVTDGTMDANSPDINTHNALVVPGFNNG